MYLKFFFLTIFIKLLGAHSLVYVIDLSNPNYKNLCYEINTQGNCTTCKVKFDQEDQLIIYKGTDKVWESEKHHHPVNLIILSSYENIDLLQVIYKDAQKNEPRSVFFCQYEGKFLSIQKDLYKKLASILREDSRKFDVNVMIDNWYLTTEVDDHKLHHINPGISVSQVVDSNRVIWNNDQGCKVTCVKVKHDKFNDPEYCEIYCFDKLIQYRHCYIKDDINWHYINTEKTQIISSTSPGERVEEFKRLHPNAGRSVVMRKIPIKVTSEVQQIIRDFGRYVLLITLSDNPHSLIPQYTDVGDYIICGMKARIYNTFKAAVTHVTDGETVFWRKSDYQYLSKVSLYQSHDSQYLLLEIEYYVKTDAPMKPAKGLKTKHHYNSYYTEYSQFIHALGKWNEHNRINYLHFKQQLIKRYMMDNKHLRFDGSFGSFFEEIYLPPRDVKVRANISYEGIRPFFRSLYDRFFVEFVPISYDINDNPFHLFDVSQHYIFSQFYLYTIKRPYSLFRLLDNDQIIWTQTEDGLGCSKLFLLRLDDESFIHLEVDSTFDPHKYYHLRKGYWHEIEHEDYISLINIKAKSYIGNTFLYRDNQYFIDRDKAEDFENKGFDESSV